MIVWVASFPKSGNTWLRMLLASWMRDADVDINALSGWTDMAPEPWRVVTGRPAETLSKDDVTTNRKWVQSVLANRRLREAMRPHFALAQAEDVFCKTHAARAEVDGHPTINHDVTVGAVYIVRDPRDVAVSYASHLGVSVDEAISLMESAHPLKNDGSPLYQYVGRWSDHVESWLAAPFKTHLVRYEDLKSRPIVTFRKLLQAFDLKSTQGRVERAVERSKFENLKAQEAKSGFGERSEKSNEPFFRAGQVGGWKNRLTPEQIARIESAHGVVMERMGYARSVALAA